MTSQVDNGLVVTTTVEDDAISLVTGATRSGVMEETAEVVLEVELAGSLTTEDDTTSLAAVTTSSGVVEEIVGIELEKSGTTELLAEGVPESVLGMTTSLANGATEAEIGDDDAS